MPMKIKLYGKLAYGLDSAIYINDMMYWILSKTYYVDERRNDITELIVGYRGQEASSYKKDEEK